MRIGKERKRAKKERNSNISGVVRKYLIGEEMGKKGVPENRCAKIVCLLWMWTLCADLGNSGSGALWGPAHAANRKQAETKDQGLVLGVWKIIRCKYHFAFILVFWPYWKVLNVFKKFWNFIFELLVNILNVMKMKKILSIRFDFFKIDKSLFWNIEEYPCKVAY